MLFFFPIYLLLHVQCDPGTVKKKKLSEQHKTQSKRMAAIRRENMIDRTRQYGASSVLDFFHIQARPYIYEDVIHRL